MSFSSSKNSDLAPEYSDNGSSSDDVLVDQASTDSSDAESGDRSKQKVDDLLKYVVKKDLNVIVTDTIKVEDDSCKFLVVELVLSRSGANKKRDAPDSSDAKRQVPNKKKRQNRSNNSKKVSSSSSNTDDSDSDSDTTDSDDSDTESGST